MRGLSQPVFALSVEFVPMDRAAAEASLDRLMDLGDYRFNASMGGRDAAAARHAVVLSGDRHWLRSHGPDGPAGDLYACLNGTLLGCRERVMTTAGEG